MKLLLDAQLARLIENGRINDGHRNDGTPERGFYPVVKLFTPDAGAVWLLTEVDPKDHDLAFGLCDLGLGFPELGSVSLSEIAAVRGRLGLRVERDRWFTPKAPLQTYAEEASRTGRIVA